MNVQLKPELKKFIDAEVRAGHFKSAEAAVETAVTQMILDHGELDDETIAAIVRADEQYERVSSSNGVRFEMSCERSMRLSDYHSVMTGYARIAASDVRITR